MTTLKGMLDTGPHGIPRFTEGQKKLVVRATHAALDHMSDIGIESADIISVVRRVVQTALQSVTTDRSCATCDYSLGRDCQHYNASIPNDEAFEAGCSNHQTDGTPF